MTKISAKGKSNLFDKCQLIMQKVAFVREKSINISYRISSIA